MKQNVVTYGTVVVLLGWSVAPIMQRVYSSHVNVFQLEPKHLQR